MSQAVFEDFAPHLGRDRRRARSVGGVLTLLVHLVGVLVLALWGRRPASPPDEGRPVIFVDVQPLVRKGRLPTDAERELLPRLTNTPDAPPGETRLGPVDPVTTPAEVPRPEEPPARLEDDKERAKRMRDALRRLQRRHPTAASVDDLPIGRPEGSNLGTAEVGTLKAHHLHQVGDALRREWKVSFIPEDELRRLSGKVRLTLDRNGVLLSYAWVTRSPNAEFNASVESCLEHFTREGDRRLPPFPDEEAFGSSVTYLYTFKSTR